MDNKGFSSSFMIYTVFIFFVILILLLLKISTSSISSTIYGSAAIKEYINKIVPYDVCLDKNKC